MQKWLLFFLVITLVLSCAACGQEPPDAAQSSAPETTIAPTTTTVNGRPVLEATVAVVTGDGSVDEYIESIGADGRKYVIGILLELSIIYMTSTLRERRTRTSFRKM